MQGDEAGGEAGMDWPTYKRLCDSPRYWSRWMLERCAGLLDAHAEPGLAALLRAAMDAAPLPRPADHRGPAATDMFALLLDRAAAGRIRALVATAAAAGVLTAEGRGLGGFVAAWDEYLRLLDTDADADADADGAAPG